MNVRITHAAEWDLEAIGDYIARDGPDRALRFLRDLREKCLSLADMPERFPLVPAFANENVRRCRHGRYLIFYRVVGSQVTILHILGGAQDYEATLFDER